MSERSRSPRRGYNGRSRSPHRSHGGSRSPYRNYGYGNLGLGAAS